MIHFLTVYIVLAGLEDIEICLSVSPQCWDKACTTFLTHARFSNSVSSTCSSDRKNQVLIYHAALTSFPQESKHIKTLAFKGPDYSMQTRDHETCRLK